MSGSLQFILMAAAASGATFNLNCTGTYTWGKMLSKPEQETQITVTYRVDLDSGRWCSGECKTTAQFYRVTDTQIVFRLSEDKEVGTDTITTVNRESGEYLDRDRLLFANLVFMTIGTCERAPFTGFPERLF